MRWSHNAKIQLADERSVDNKLSTIETIDKLMMGEALQQCLSRFPKIDTHYKAEQLISGRDIINILQFCRLILEKA